MAGGVTGWYPDPGGARGRYRHWNGTNWSSETTDDPRQAPPVDPDDAADRRPRRLGLIIGVLALVVVVIVALGVTVTRGWPTAEPPLPTSTVVGGDDSSPTPTPTPPSRTASPSPSSRTPAPLVPCPVGDPTLRLPHPTDDRVYGGNLSFVREASFLPAEPETRISFGWDVAQQDFAVHDDPGWIAQLAVGQLRAADGFVHGAQNTAESFVQCAITGNMYNPYDPTRRDRRSEPLTIDGHPGWVIETDITVTTAGLPFPGDRTVFIVVADGNDWGLFFGAVPIGNAALGRVLTETVRSLQAS